MQRLLPIAHVLGALLVLMALTFLVPLGWALAIDEAGSVPSFALPAAGCVLIGAGVWLPTRPYRRELQARDGCLLVVLVWVVMSAIAAVPFMIELPSLSFTDAYFESMAGLTTTGATVLTGLQFLPQSLNVWRHALQWYGGMGIIVLAVAVLPLLGVGGRQLFRAEMPGPLKEGRLAPRIAQTAKYLWLVYAGLTGACILALRVAGMDWFDAVCHGFSAMALGGFSTHDASIARFDSLAIELTLVVFMFIAVTSFISHLLALRAHSPLVYLRDPEARAVYVALIGSTIVISVFLWVKGTYADYPTALRHALFNTVSLGTSTGYASVDYGAWPAFGSMWLLMLGCVASSAGSTGGGIKMLRTLILIKQSGRELLRIIHPRVISPLHIGGQAIPTEVTLAVLGFMLLYGLTIASLTFVMLATGMEFLTAVSSIVASVNNIGPGLGSVGPAHNYQMLTDFQKWVCVLAMLAGRLELLTFFAVVIPSFWRR